MRASCLAVVAAIGLVGCAATHVDKAPTDTRARDTVVRFIRLADGGEFRAACGLLGRLPDQPQMDAVEEVRLLALTSLTPNATTYEAIKRENASKRPRANTCPGALSLVFDVLGTRAAALAERAGRLPQRWPHPLARDFVFLGNDEWDLWQRDGEWRIIGFQALASAVAQRDR